MNGPTDVEVAREYDDSPSYDWNVTVYLYLL